MTSRIRAFTLIEILVAIGILAILIGILLPTLGQVRKSGRDAMCKSNIQQIGLATHSYATDHDEYFINYRNPNPESSHRIWDKPATGGDWWSSRLVVLSYLPQSDVYLCPAFETTVSIADALTVKPTDANAQEGAGAVAWNKIHYGMNVRFLGSRQGWAFPEGNEWNLPTENGTLTETPRLSEIKNISKTISHTDSKNRAWEIITTEQAKVDASTRAVTEGIGYLFPAYDPPEIQFGYSHARHNLTINTAWADGHAESVNVNDEDNPYGPDELTSVPDHPDSNYWDLR